MGKSEDLFNKEIIVSDELSIHRTNLANERSLLSYIRTTATAILVGISFIKLFEVGLLHFLGYLVILGAIGILIAGLRNFKKTQRLIDKEVVYIRSLSKSP